MDEAVLSAIASAAMLTAEQTENLAGDLRKIEVMTARAAEEQSVKNGPDKTSADDFLGKMGVSGDEKTPLRNDEAKKYTDGNIVSASKRYEGVYTSVPRIV